MRTIIELPNDLLNALDRIAENRSLPRAEIIRRAIRFYLQQEVPTEEGEAFGIWRGRHIDALAYEDALRSEWASESDEQRMRLDSSEAQ